MEISKVWNYDVLLGYQSAINDMIEAGDYNREKLLIKKNAVEEQMERVLNSMANSRLTD